MDSKAPSLIASLFQLWGGVMSISILKDPVNGDYGLEESRGVYFGQMSLRAHTIVSTSNFRYLTGSKLQISIRLR